jgi:hypothetical protein
MGEVEGKITPSWDAIRAVGSLDGVDEELLIEVGRLLSNQLWRLDNLYKIVDDNGIVMPFKMKMAQRRLFLSLHYRNVILKSRQHGFTTLLAILALDTAMWNAHHSTGIIAHTLPDAQKIFRKKVKFAYENLEGLVDLIKPKLLKESSDELVFDNGSSVSVSVSFRGGTLQLLHVSELGKIAAKHPEKAEEIKTGAFEAVPLQGIIVVESTAEGSHGVFKDLSDTAQAVADSGRKLTQLDWRMHFVPWWIDPKYKLSTEETLATPIPQRLTDYFNRLDVEHGIKLTPRQRAWYTAKEQYLGQLMWREYPSIPEEPFKVALDGAYWSRQMRQARTDGRITKVPVQSQIPVNTWWDIGRDTTAIWLSQDVGYMVHLVGYIQDSGEGLEFYNKKLIGWRDENKILFNKHYFPHDMGVTEWGSSMQRIEQAAAMGLYGEVLPRMANKDDGIEAGRNFLQRCVFDEEACEEGIASLESYRKEWDQIRGTWKERPLHDWASHGADAFQQLALNHSAAIQVNAEAKPVLPGRKF